VKILRWWKNLKRNFADRFFCEALQLELEKALNHLCANYFFQLIIHHWAFLPRSLISRVSFKIIFLLEISTADKAKCVYWPTNHSTNLLLHERTYAQYILHSVALHNEFNWNFFASIKLDFFSLFCLSRHGGVLDLFYCATVCGGYFQIIK
jgi:hypothetical protein